MTGEETSAYGLWSLVVINSAIFILFALSFFKPQSKRDWRSLGAFSAFIVALFTEMYGYPLTVYLLSGWLSEVASGIDIMSHDAGHLLTTVLGIEGNPHFGVLHIISNVLVIAGFFVISAGWRVLHAAHKDGTLARTGLYAWVRHPQYAGFMLVMVGFLFQWPTLLTVVMFPVLVVMYTRLALHEEEETRRRFPDEWDEYAAAVPRFIPRLTSSREADHFPTSGR